MGNIERCERLLVGQGGDTWDPLCWRPKGHGGICEPVETVVVRLETQLAGAVSRHEALLERVARLERALEIISETSADPGGMRIVANNALNSERFG